MSNADIKNLVNLNDYDKNLIETMPIEVIQKEAVITEKEVKENKTLILKVSISIKKLRKFQDHY